jgi:PAS domain S-box-containing protein
MALEANRQQRYDIAENLPGAVFTYAAGGDSSRRLLYISPGLSDLLGPDAWAAVRRRSESFFDLMHPDDRTVWDRERSAAGRDRPLDCECRFKTDAGGYKWVRSIARPVAGDGGETVWHGILLDNTESRRAAEIERDRRMVLEKLAAGTPLKEILAMLVESSERIFPGMKGSILLLDRGSRRLRGGAAPSLPGFYNDAVDGLEIGPDVACCGRAAFTGERVIVEDVMTHSNWEPFRGLAERAGLRSCWSEPIFSSTNDVLGTFAVYYDAPRVPEGSDLEFIQTAAHLAGIAIERKLSGDALGDSQERLRLALESAGQGMWDWNIAAGEVYCNDQTLRLFGLEPGEETTDPEFWSRRVHPQDLPAVRKAVRDHLEGRAPIFESEHRIRTESGEQRWLAAWGRIAERSQDGAPRRLTGTVMDITERRSAEEKMKIYSAALEKMNDSLTEATLAAEAATKAKSDFLANMSHEIRTPMTAIMGFTDILSEKACGEDVDEAIRIIRSNGEYLLRLINDILDLSKIEAGRMELEFGSVSPCEIIDEVHRLMEVRAAERKLAFNVEYTTQMPEAVRSDQVRLKQILINLIGNAIKFTEEGEVRLEVACLDPHADEPRIRFDVIDTGIGMSEEQMARLFNPFTQADTSTTRRFGGTGLGLTICKRFAEMLGGEITVKSRPGRGSTFRLLLPTGSLKGVNMIRPAARSGGRQGKGADPADPVAPDLCCRILVAEDNPMIQKVTAHILDKIGAEVTLADNGRLAVEAAVSARNAGHPFDLILMDMQMPVCDGYRATRELREAGFSEPIIALTASAMASDRQACLEVGCTDFASKPIDMKLLLRLILEHVRGRNAA